MENNRTYVAVILLRSGRYTLNKFILPDNYRNDVSTAIWYLEEFKNPIEIIVACVSWEEYLKPLNLTKETENVDEN